MTDPYYSEIDLAALDRLQAALATVYGVSQVLSRSLNLNETMREVLHILDREADIHQSVISLSDQENMGATVCVVHGLHGPMPIVRYETGEGLTGMVLARGQTISLERLSNEERFLDRLGIFNAELPFIAVPIKVGPETVGVLAVQPEKAEGLDDYTQLVEMVANLIGQSVRLTWQVAREKRDLTEERDTLRRTVKRESGFANIVGQSKDMKRVFEQIRQVAKWNTTVLIRGETGTGKELIANAIHYNSPRGGGPFVKMNCAALPENLLESELFGHEKGAFTGAITQRKGRFEQADGGTLFLDEIGEVSAAFQAKLLRILQEGELERVGGNRTLKVDVRVIAATHRDLEKAVEEGNFREDLYYRLNVMPIFVPALFERMEDIPEIAHHLLERIGKDQGRELILADSAVRVLLAHHWPGNVRELQNCLERASVMSESGEIDRDVLALCGLSDTPSAARTVSVDLDDPNLSERERVVAALEMAGWVQAKAARLLNMTPRQIAYRVQTLDIPMKHI